MDQQFDANSKRLIQDFIEGIATIDGLLTDEFEEKLRINAKGFLDEANKRREDRHLKCKMP